MGKIYKGYCTKCKKREDVDRIFEIKSLEYSKCFCPHCFAEYTPTEAYENYLKLIKEKLAYANSLFFRELNFTSAYQIYAKVIEIENDNVEALLGRVLSLLCLSTVRKAYFTEAKEMISMNEEKFSNDGLSLFFEFASRALVSTSYYLRKLKNRLRYSNRFFDSECVSLYLQRVKEALLLYNFINLILVKKKIKIDSDRIVLKNYEHNIQYLKEVLAYEYLLIDGSIYKLSRFSTNGVALISKQKESKSPLKAHKYLKATLNLENKDSIPIRNYIFNSWQTLLSWNLVTLPLGIIFGVAAIIFTVLKILAEFGVIHSEYNVLFLVLAITLGVFSITALVAKIFIGKYFRKKSAKLTLSNATFDKR